MTFIENGPSLLIATEKTGGLFDLDGTLPLVAVQFLVLMFVLDFILYTPLLKVIEDRNSYVGNNLAEAAKILSKANELTKIYETKLTKARKISQVQITNAQKSYKEVLEKEIQLTQSDINKKLIDITSTFGAKKRDVLTSLENEVDSLSNEIIGRILT